MKIFVVGLGCESGDVSLRGWQAITEANKVFAKSDNAPAYHVLKEIPHESLDCLTARCNTVGEADLAVVRTLLESAQTQSVVYCVAGDGMTDRSVLALKAANADVQIFPAVCQGGDLLCQETAGEYLVADAREVLTKYEINTDVPVIVRGISDATLAKTVKQKLLMFYEKDRQVRFLGGNCRLDEIDKILTFPSEILILPRLLTEKERFSFGDLIHIMEILIGENGCPWDKVQTHESIRGNLVEEAYEAIEAIDSEDLPNMVEEMGDILLQSVFHCVIAEKKKEFSYRDMLDHLCGKLLFRHPHVFGTIKADNADSALGSWEAAKAVEKQQSTVYEKIQSIPKVFPQSLRAIKLGKYSTRVGIGADIDTDEYFDMIKENLDRFTDAESQERLLGECFYALCCIALKKGLDPEIALKKVLDFYSDRVRKIESLLAARGLKLVNADKSEVDRAVAEVIYGELVGS